MNTVQARNHETMIGVWSEYVERFRKEIDEALQVRGGIRDHFRSELRTYGLCLAYARERLEREQGVDGTARSLAGQEYLSLLAELLDLLKEGRDHGVVGSPSYGFPTLGRPYEERLEDLEKAVDKAMLRWSAEHVN